MEKELFDLLTQHLLSKKLELLENVARSFAHEINSPLAATSSSITNAKCMIAKLIFNLDKYYHLYSNHKPLINSLMIHIINNDLETHTKNIYHIRNEILKQLESSAVKHPDIVSQLFIEIDLIDDYQKYLVLFQGDDSEDIVDMLSCLSGLRSSLKIMNYATQLTSNRICTLLGSTCTHYSQGKTKMSDIIFSAIMVSAVKLRSNIKLSLSLDESIYLTCKANELCLAFVKLIQNAIDAIGCDCGTLNITLEKVSGFAKVSFLHSGTGISDEDMKLLFNLDNSNTKKCFEAELLFVNDIIKQHNGKVLVEKSDEKTGYAFMTLLPIGL